MLLLTKAKETELGLRSYFTHVQSSLLQRKCNCGGSASVEDKQKELWNRHLQRSSINPCVPYAVPPVVHETLSSPGQPMDRKVRAFMELTEGIVRWEFSRPYLIAHGVDGYCVHLDRNSYQCTVRNNRPVPCHGFGCQDDKKWKVWTDYKKQLLNNEMIEKSNEKIYACLETKTNG